MSAIFAAASPDGEPARARCNGTNLVGVAPIGYGIEASLGVRREIFQQHRGHVTDQPSPELSRSTGQVEVHGDVDLGATGGLVKRRIDQHLRLASALLLRALGIDLERAVVAVAFEDFGVAIE